MQPCVPSAQRIMRRSGAFFALLILTLTAVVTNDAAAQTRSQARSKKQNLQKQDPLPQKPGTHEQTLESSKKKREYLLHIPRGYKKKQKKLLPLVVMLHGRTGSGRGAASGYYGWKQLSEREKFIAVFPTALGSPTSWKGAWRGTPTVDSIYLAELIDLLLEQLRIDKNRVFMTGHSSGGFMSFSFAATHPEKVAAIGPVAGLMVGSTRPKTPVSVISFHGMADDVVKYGKKGGRRGMLGAEDSAAFFAENNESAKVERTETAKGSVHIDTWKGGKDGTTVMLYSIVSGDHGWPQGGSRSVAATKLIWSFFAKHPRTDRAKKTNKKAKSARVSR